MCDSGDDVGGSENESSSNILKEMVASGYNWFKGTNFGQRMTNGTGNGDCINKDYLLGKNETNAKSDYNITFDKYKANNQVIPLVQKVSNMFTNDSKQESFVISGEEWYYRRAQELKIEHPNWTTEQITNKMSEIIWNNNYNELMNNIANSRSPAEREQKIREHQQELEKYMESGINVPNDILYLRNTQGIPANQYTFVEGRYILEPNNLLFADKNHQPYTKNIDANTTREYNKEYGLYVDNNHAGVPTIDQVQIYKDFNRLRETVRREFFDGLKNIQFGNYPPMSLADREEGYHYLLMPNGIDYVRAKFEDGEWIIHPEDREKAQESEKGLAKDILLGGIIPVGSKLMGAGKNILSNFLKQGSGKVEPISAKDSAQLLATQAERVAAQKAAKDAAQVANKSGWVDKAGKVYWPDNGGFVGKTRVVRFEKGTLLDRYGTAEGSYVSPAGTTFEMRALAPGTENATYKIYEVVKPFDGLGGEVAPWFNQQGGAIQYKFNASIRMLLENGCIKEYLER